jgi:hypothetical protein
MIGWPVPEYHDSDTRCPGSGSEVAVSLKHLVNIAELESLGVAFVSLRDSLDLSSPVGRLMAQLLGAISEFERSLITERVRAGIRNARNSGRTLGRPRHCSPGSTEWFTGTQNSITFSRCKEQEEMSAPRWRSKRQSRIPITGPRSTPRPTTSIGRRKGGLRLTSLSRFRVYRSPLTRIGVRSETPTVPCTSGG